MIFNMIFYSIRKSAFWIESTENLNSFAFLSTGVCPCLNGGSCLPVADGKTSVCQCPQNYGGVLCEGECLFSRKVAVKYRTKMHQGLDECAAGSKTKQEEGDKVKVIGFGVQSQRYVKHRRRNQFQHNSVQDNSFKCLLETTLNFKAGIPNSLHSTIYKSCMEWIKVYYKVTRIDYHQNAKEMLFGLFS